MPPYKGSTAFERMKTLVGKWSGESPIMGKMNREFHLIDSDSVIEERIPSGTPIEMLSVDHDLNGKLTMTHCCMLRNQPRKNLVKSTARPTPSSTRTTSSLKACRGKMERAPPAAHR